MALSKCRKCEYEFDNEAETCPGCGTPVKMWPLAKFTWSYFVAGAASIGLYTIFGNSNLAEFLIIVWLLVGLGVAFIAYGRSRRSVSDVAGLIYLAGIAWLIVLLGVGMYRIFY